MSELINREKAIDRINGTGYAEQIKNNLILILRALPPAESQLEIIRCENCKHYKEWESEFTPNAVVTQCMADNFPIRKAIPDGWFCAGAERRTDG